MEYKAFQKQVSKDFFSRNPVNCIKCNIIYDINLFITLVSYLTFSYTKPLAEQVLFFNKIKFKCAI